MIKMTSFKLSTALVFLSSMVTFLNLTIHDVAAQNYLKHVCGNTTVAQNSIYSSNINSLLSSLSSQATGNIAFYNTTVGQTTSSPVYGLFNCRGDVTADMCRRCVLNATQKLSSKCSTEKVALTWYDECMVRYSNESIFSTVALTPRLNMYNTQNMTDQDRFNRQVNTTLTQLATEASNFPIGVKKFGVKAEKFSEFQNLYTLVQCTRDLSGTDCNSCLQAAINRLAICCSGSQGARTLYPSCNVGYELYLFYDVPTAPTRATPPAAALPPPISGKNKISRVTIISIVVPIAACVLLLALAYCFLTRRAGKKFNAVKREKSKKSDHIQIYQDGVFGAMMKVISCPIPFFPCLF
ncbi:cysteine-rich receptor-like protein kinase 10 [Corylus avellana]|uniref:cysteine-rich receptor-like protein kinase 10 n=1 Tax=Corylus avellana TaxID=13451 RepID=UPI002869FA94|nr:cysteine-rich receptor-like protein kinase 10 [Corylus avellana]